MDLEAHAEELIASQETLEYQFNELQVKNNRIENLLTYDENTKFMNVNPFIDYIQEQIALSKPFQVVYLSMHNIKDIGNIFNHGIANLITGLVADRMRMIFDEAKYQFGVDKGQHFFVITHLDEESLQNKLSALSDALLEPIQAGYYTTHVNTYIGVASYPEHAVHPHELLRYAGIAATTASINGDDVFTHFNQTMINDVVNIQKRMHDLDIAIENQEFVIHLQPKYNSTDYDLIGFEALVRWQNPENGLIYPDEFIELAENTGQIKKITELVVEQVAKFISQFQTWDSKIHVSLNLSSVDLKDFNIITRINRIMDGYMIPHSCIELELTESSLLNDFDLTCKILKQFQAEGYTISLDDFGTGYSSLSYINILPVDKIKIDRSFVNNLNEEKHFKVVSSIINLVHDMDYRITVEGIENEEQLDLLRPFKPEEYQGYYFSKPLPIEQIVKLLN